MFVSFIAVTFNPLPATAAEQTSSNGTRAKQIVDAEGAVWTFDGTKALRNGIWVPRGRGEEYFYFNGTVYVITGIAGVWKWNGSRLDLCRCRRCDGAKHC